jgi:hypothetical protein
MIKTTKTSIISIVALILCLSSFCAADTSKDSSNYCKDEVSWQQWHELLEKHPRDDAIYALYATRQQFPFWPLGRHREWH